MDIEKTSTMGTGYCLKHQIVPQVFHLNIVVYTLSPLQYPCGWTLFRISIYPHEHIFDEEEVDTVARAPAFQERNIRHPVNYPLDNWTYSRHSGLRDIYSAHGGQAWYINNNDLDQYSFHSFQVKRHPRRVYLGLEW